MKKSLRSGLGAALAVMAVTSVTCCILNTASLKASEPAEITDISVCLSAADNAVISLAEYNLNLRDVIAITDRNVITSSLSEMKDAKKEYDEYADKVSKLLTDNKDKRTFESITSEYYQYISKAEELSANGSTTDWAVSGHYHRVAVEKLDPLYDELTQSWDALRESITAKGNKPVEKSNAPLVLSVISYIIAGISVIFAAAYGFVTSKKISEASRLCVCKIEEPAASGIDSTPFSETDRIINAVDKKVMPAKKKDDIVNYIGAVFNSVLKNVNDAELEKRFGTDYSNLRNSSLRFAERYAELHKPEPVPPPEPVKIVETVTKTVKPDTSECEKAMSELNSSVAALSESISSHKDSTVTAVEQSSQEAKLLREGSESVSGIYDAMSEIMETNESISEILRSIQDIAFQTNILALNAAVEAAGAGQAGKGFAVVADEVRNLAVKTAKASEESEELIKRSGKAIEKGGRVAEKAVRDIRQAIDKNDALTDTLSKISKSAEKGISDAKKTDSDAKKLSDAVSKLK